MIFLGPLYQQSREEEILSLCTRGMSNAPNQFQTRLLEGFVQNGTELSIINVLPVGTWKKGFKKIILDSSEWSFHGHACHEVGCINLPLLKQWGRERRVRRLLRRMTAADKEVVIYSAYLPFLRAAKRLPTDVKVTLIVTDLPEYYDLGRVSPLRKLLRRINNRRVYSAMERVDRFVLLTEAMKEPLSVGDRPYTVVEGIGSAEEPPSERQGREVIFYSGTLHYRFGIRQLLDAFAMYDREDIELWICGAGEAAEEIEQLSRTDSRVKCFGFVSSQRVRELRREATVLVNPRTDEGEYTKYSFPSKTMEYMASGIPVVMHKLSGIPDEYDEHLTYIRGTSASDLKRAIDTVLYMDAHSRRILGEGAARFITEQKNERVQAAKIIDLVQLHQ